MLDELGAKPKDVFQPVRVAICGTTVSPGIFESVAALGRDETLARIDRALAHAASRLAILNSGHPPADSQGKEASGRRAPEPS